MSVRLLLAVVFAVALLSVAIPAVEDARHARRVAATERAASQVDTAAEALVASGTPPPAGTSGARRTLELRLPADTALVLQSRSRILELHVDGRQTGARAVPIPLWSRSGDLRLTGTVHVTMSYERRGGDPVLVVVRGFMRESEAKKDYDIPGPLPPSRNRSVVACHALRVHR